MNLFYVHFVFCFFCIIVFFQYLSSPLPYLICRFRLPLLAGYVLLCVLSYSFWELCSFTLYIFGSIVIILLTSIFTSIFCSTQFSIPFLDLFLSFVSTLKSVATIFRLILSPIFPTSLQPLSPRLRLLTSQFFSYILYTPFYPFFFSISSLIMVSNKSILSLFRYIIYYIV